MRTPKELVVPIPSFMSFEEAATIPATFLTAYYSLFYLARLEKGESVLIHAAAGGVGMFISYLFWVISNNIYAILGQAAIQLCKMIGAEIFVTAGSDEKRNFLQTEFDIPSDHIMGSRTLDFVDQIKERTNGRGKNIFCV